MKEDCGMRILFFSLRNPMFRQNEKWSTVLPDKDILKWRLTELAAVCLDAISVFFHLIEKFTSTTHSQKRRWFTSIRIGRWSTLCFDGSTQSPIHRQPLLLIMQTADFRMQQTKMATARTQGEGWPRINWRRQADFAQRKASPEWFGSLYTVK